MPTLKRKLGVGDLGAAPGCFVGVRVSGRIEIVPAADGRTTDDSPVSASHAFRHVDWIPVSERHVTFCYLGWLQAKEQQNVRAILKTIVDPPEMRLTGELAYVGTDPRRRLIAIVKPDALVLERREQLSQELRRAKMSTTDAFLPHVTVALNGPWEQHAPDHCGVSPIRLAGPSWAFLHGRSRLIELDSES